MIYLSIAFASFIGVHHDRYYHPMCLCAYLEDSLDVSFHYSLRWLIIFDLRFTYSSLFSLIWRGGICFVTLTEKFVFTAAMDGGNGVSTSTKWISHFNYHRDHDDVALLFAFYHLTVLHDLRLPRDADLITRSWSKGTGLLQLVLEIFVTSTAGWWWARFCFSFSFYVAGEDAVVGCFGRCCIPSSWIKNIGIMKWMWRRGLSYTGGEFFFDRLAMMDDRR